MVSVEFGRMKEEAKTAVNVLVRGGGHIYDHN
jgi:hypothetical protein